MTDAVRLPNGKTVTTARARSRGWIDADGNLTALAPRPVREQAIIDKEIRSRQWRERQGLAPAGDTADELAALAGKRPSKAEPLRPQNVTPDGEPVTDEALLAEITAQTLAIENLAAGERRQKARQAKSE